MKKINDGNNILLRSDEFQVEISKDTGAIIRISHPDDAHVMNWVCNPVETPWQPLGNGWGLGYAVVKWPGNNQHRWQQPTEIKISETSVCCIHQLPMMQVSVTRTLTQSGILEESFEFKNCTGHILEIWGLALATPWNDNYPNAETCINRRCNAHVWCGGNVVYTCATRMGDMAPHLGMVMTDGNIGGYSIFDRGMTTGGSNQRGSIFLNHQGFTLEPGAERKVAWQIFWHAGQDDFYQKARLIPGFINMSASNYTIAANNTATIKIDAPTINNPIKIIHADKTDIVDSSGCVTVSPDTNGDYIINAEYGEGKKSWLRLLSVPPVADLIRARVNFILDKQQVNDPQSLYDGAFVPYDNLVETQFRNPYWTDQNEARERLGMGVLLALWAQRESDPRIENALRRYHNFVRSKLQKPDGTVMDAVNSEHQRMYNYPWTAHLHLEMFNAYGDEEFLDDFVTTCRAYYQRGGQRFYCIGMPVIDGITALKFVGRYNDADEMLNMFRKHADELVDIGVSFPPHEVNYEQTIVTPAVIIPLEFYYLTREEKYINHVRRVMPLLESFNGRQPDHHLNGISIRHWDGFWFGRRRMWGDTFPHYWSTTSGMTFLRYWQATGDESFLLKARNTLMNNLSLFTPDGRGSCAYIYPDAVNGEPGRLYDELANDQDWALVFMLMAANIDENFEKEYWGENGNYEL